MEECKASMKVFRKKYHDRFSVNIYLSPNKTANEASFKFQNVFHRLSEMGIGWTGKTCLKSPVKQQDLFKQNLLNLILVVQGTRVRRENVSEFLAVSIAQMMTLVRT